MSVRIIHAHVLDGLAQIEDESVHMVVTSPPYYGLRSYGTEPQVWGGDPACEHVWEPNRIVLGDHNWRSAEWKTGGLPDVELKDTARLASQGGFCRCGAWRGDLGLEPTVELYLAHMVEVFAEVKRVLRKDGTLWLNIGDSYATASGAGQAKPRDRDLPNAPAGWSNRNAPTVIRTVGGTAKPKDLLMIPAQLALALRADGWWLRSEIVWAKKAPMPESCTDRPTCAHEKVFLLTKSARYFYDAEAVKEEAEYGENRATYAGGNDRIRQANICSGGATNSDKGVTRPKVSMRNVWHLGPEPFPEAHFATFVSEIPRRAILAGTSAKGVCPKCGAPWCRVVETSGRPVDYQKIPGTHATRAEDGQGMRMADRWVTSTQTIGWRASCSCYSRSDDWSKMAPPIPATVLDPFLGSGTTALVADQLGRHCIGIELTLAYAAMSERRLRDDAGMFLELAAE
ncbi:MAG TPA: site-specific DNA-methyltransferase [Xanthobacteraceae bacterium]|nr:site-specific DNA-methyltransferase [Xanthobacteraceae bacterium]